MNREMLIEWVLWPNPCLQVFATWGSVLIRVLDHENRACLFTAWKHKDSVSMCRAYACERIRPQVLWSYGILLNVWGKACREWKNKITLGCFSHLMWSWTISVYLLTVSASGCCTPNWFFILFAARGRGEWGQCWEMVDKRFSTDNYSSYQNY